MHTRSGGGSVRAPVYMYMWVLRACIRLFGVLRDPPP
jgi:hypothetical protein